MYQYSKQHHQIYSKTEVSPKEVSKAFFRIDTVFRRNTGTVSDMFIRIDLCESSSFCSRKKLLKVVKPISNLDNIEHLKRLLKDYKEIHEIIYSDDTFELLRYIINNHGELFLQLKEILPSLEFSSTPNNTKITSRTTGKNKDSHNRTLHEMS